MRLFQKIFCALIICVGAYWMTFWRFFLGNGGNSDSLQMLIDGVAARPFQYRILVPLIERYATNLLTAMQVKPLPLFVPSQLMFSNVIEAQVIFFLEFVLLLAVIFYFWHYLNLLLQNEISGFLFSLLLLAILPFHYMHSGFPIWYPYDTSSILVLILGLIFLLEKKTLPFYVLLLIGTFNRETTIFLVLLHVFVNWNIRKRPWIVTHLCFQMCAWVCVKIILFLAYRDNSGELFQIHLWENFRNILFAKESAVAGGLYGFVIIASLFGFLWLPTLLFRHFVKNDFVNSTLLIIPFFAAGMMFVGIVTEVRIFGELIPIILSAFALIVTESSRRSPVTRAQDHVRSITQHNT